MVSWGGWYTATYQGRRCAVVVRSRIRSWRRWGYSGVMRRAVDARPIATENLLLVAALDNATLKCITSFGLV